jgi:hypothetical protein
LGDGAALIDTDPKIEAIYEKMLQSRSGVERLKSLGGSAFELFKYKERDFKRKEG